MSVRLQKRIEALAPPERLQGIEGLRIVGTAAHKAGVISFTLGDIHPHDLGTILEAVLNHSSRTKEPEELAEWARRLGARKGTDPGR